MRALGSTRGLGAVIGGPPIAGNGHSALQQPLREGFRRAAELSTRAACAPQSQVAGSQNDDIVLRFHFEFGWECMLTSNIAKQTSNIS